MNHLKETVRAGFQKLLARHLPGRTKRLILLASFTALLKNSTSLNKETVHRLNKLMVLATEESAIQLPIQLSRTIWKDTDFEVTSDGCLLDACTSEYNIEMLSEQVCQKTPWWLRYGEEKQDVEKLLLNRNLVFGS